MIKLTHFPPLKQLKVAFNGDIVWKLTKIFLTTWEVQFNSFFFFSLLNRRLPPWNCFFICYSATGQNWTYFFQLVIFSYSISFNFFSPSYQPICLFTQDSVFTDDPLSLLPQRVHRFKYFLYANDSHSISSPHCSMMLQSQDLESLLPNYWFQRKMFFEEFTMTPLCLQTCV